ncbi:MAG: hypothetical protein HYV09_38245 [Deltaproteobacteria bacterium]|nr:hypothetical protein [Deltaproteobacteria bacterium]
MTVTNVTWTIAELAIQPSSTGDKCAVRFGENTAGPSSVRTGAAPGGAARIVGLRPDTTYLYSASCEGSAAANGTFRTITAPGPLPPLPKIVGVAALKGPSSIPAGPVTVKATYGPTAGVATACWFELSTEAIGPYYPLSEAECSQPGGTMSIIMPAGAAMWVRLAMRNASGRRSSTALRVPP